MPKLRQGSAFASWRSVSVTLTSVVVPSYRKGGLDVLFDSLALQTFTDFELIIADELHSHRADIVSDKSKYYPFPIKHIAPDGGPELSNYCRSINNAIAHASGELIVIQTDYTWMPPDCLANHWFNYQKSDRKSCFMLDNHCTTLPPLHPEFRGYGPDLELFTEDRREEIEAEINAGADQYAADLAAGKLDGLMWSIFAEDGHIINTPNGPAWLDHKRGMSALPVTRSHTKGGQSLDPNWASLKNEGIPTEAFLAVNGIDERLDGSHLYQDQSFAWCVARAGYRWTTAPGGEVYIINPRTKMSCKRVSRPMRFGSDSNEARFKATQASSAVRVNEHRDLRKERDANVGV